VDDTAAAIEARGRKTLRVTSDVSDRASLEKLLAATLEKFGEWTSSSTARARSSAHPL